MIAAVVPAAGESRRMGEPKLLLRLGGRTVIARVVSALTGAGVTPVVVVVPPPDAPGHGEIVREVSRANAGCAITPPVRPADMRGSVEIALRHVETWVNVSTVLLAPGDSPGLSIELVARVMRRAEERPEAIVVPTSGGRRGHPVALPRDVAFEVFGLPPDVGVNALIRRHADRVEELIVDDAGAVDDLDTQEDYRRWAERC